MTQTPAPSGWWQRLLQRAAPFEVDTERWIVLDVEATGLDPRRDALLAVAAVAVRVEATERRLCIAVGDSFEAVLRPEGVVAAPTQATRDNILVHRIGLGARAQGRTPEDGLAAFERYVGRSPLLAFHVEFDRTLVQRHMTRHLGRRLPNPWVDVEHVAAALARQPRRLALDDWMRRFGIRCLARHHAIADALATAELLLRLWPGLRERGQASWDGVERVAGEVAFLPGR